MEMISPKYQMHLVTQVSQAIWAQFGSYENVMFYIKKWQKDDDFLQNFYIILKHDKNIDLQSTLHSMDSDIIVKIAIDMGVETPDFIPSIPVFRNIIKAEFETSSATFEKAFKQIEEHPDIAVGLVNSALEGLIKEIIKDERITTKSNTNKTLYELTIDILKEFQLFPNTDMPLEIKTIGSSLLSINQSIEKLRSEKTSMHGKTSDDYILKDPLYAYFILNSVATVGLFLNSFYKMKFPKPLTGNNEINDEDDLPF